MSNTDDKKEEFTTYELLTSWKFYEVALAVVGFISIVNIAFRR